MAKDRSQGILCRRVENSRGQQFTALRVNQSVTSVPGASEGHRSSLQGGASFLLQGLMGRERGQGRASLSGALSNSWGRKGGGGFKSCGK